MEKIYLVMNKPSGYVCSAVSDSHKTVYSLLPLEYEELLFAKRGERIHTVGRLDCDTSGLLIFTTDGEFSNLLTRPESHVSKTYLVTLRDSVSLEMQSEYIEKMKKGVMLPAEKKAPEQQSGPADVEFISHNKCVVSLNEGKFHQVKRMFLAVENEVTDLKRIKTGNLELSNNLAPGQYIVMDKQTIYVSIFA